MEKFVGKYQQVSYKKSVNGSYDQYISPIETIEISREEGSTLMWILRLSDKQGRRISELRFEIGKSGKSTGFPYGWGEETTWLFTYEGGRLLATQTGIQYGGTHRWEWEINGANLNMTITFNENKNWECVLGLKRI